MDTGKTFHVLVAQGPDGIRTASYKVLMSRADFARADAQLRTQDGLYRADYEALLARGSTRTKAVCSIARKLVPLLLEAMRSDEPFEVDRWAAHRHQRAVA